MADLPPTRSKRQGVDKAYLRFALASIAASIALLTSSTHLLGKDSPSESSLPFAKPAEAIPDYHVVFSTSCSDQQDWESYVFFYHALKVRQPGTVTRIVSGCTPKRRASLQRFHDEFISAMRKDFYVHFTPEFGRLNKTLYKYMNKPFGLKHWMENELKMNDRNATTQKVQDSIIILMDPDMILLRPILHEYPSGSAIYAGEDPLTYRVERGKPIAQQDGYLGDQWAYLDISYITNGSQLSPKPTRKYSSQHWNAGPPYLAVASDFYDIATLWTQYAPRVYQIHPKLFAEMYGYIIAATQLKLPHTLIKSLVVSSTTTDDREGWQFVDRIPDDRICTPTDPSHQSALVALHYCSRYFLSDFFFSKYRAKKKIISCPAPLFMLPPAHLITNKTVTRRPPPPNKFYDKGPKTTVDGKYVRPVWDPPIEKISPRQAKREVFMACGLMSAINEASRHFKRLGCSNDTSTNFEETYKIHDDPNDYN